VVNRRCSSRAISCRCNSVPIALSLLVPRTLSMPAWLTGLADRLSVGDDRQALHGRPRQLSRARSDKRLTLGVVPGLVGR
jgi:hypothetical protein